MEKIFKDYNDQYVMAVIAYGHTDKKLYVDATHTTQLTQAEATELFKKNLLMVSDGTNLFKPVKLAGAKVYTMDVVSSAVSLVSWDAKASA